MTELVYEWHDGGWIGEPLVWSKNGRGAWAAVWPFGARFRAWVSRPDGRQLAEHQTEADAKVWCEQRLTEHA